MENSIFDVMNRAEIVKLPCHHLRLELAFNPLPIEGSTYPFPELAGQPLAEMKTPYLETGILPVLVFQSNLQPTS